MNKKIPMRQCIGCGQMKPKRDMLRILKLEDGSVALDPSGKRNGRGAYVCRNRECLKLARRQHGLERSFKIPVSNAVYDALENDLEQLLSL